MNIIKLLFFVVILFLMSKNVFAQEIPFIADAYEIGNSFESTAYKKIGNEMVGKLSFYSIWILWEAAKMELQLLMPLYLKKSSSCYKTLTLKSRF